MISLRIESITKFKEIKEKSKRVILITDKITGNHIHYPFCSYVTEQNYIEKVIDNKSKYGEYYWYEDVSHVKKEHTNFQLCGKCHLGK